MEFSATAPDRDLGGRPEPQRLTPFVVVTDIEFGLELFADGTFAVVEHGVNLTGPLGAYAAGDRFAIAVTGGVLRYQRNGVTIYTSTGTPLYPLRVDAALFTPGATIADVVLAGRLVHLGGVAGDVDNDGKSDLTVFRPSTGGWHTLKSSTDYTTSQSRVVGPEHGRAGAGRLRRRRADRSGDLPAVDRPVGVSCSRAPTTRRR